MVVALVATGCNLDSGRGDGGDSRGSSSGGDSIDPTPERLDGSESREFESDDIERARGASEKLKDYCADAVSEAQAVGCLSHVDEGDIP